MKRIRLQDAARDEAVATASRTVSIAGSLTAPHVTAPLTVNRADINLPDSLPPNVVVLKVTEANSKTGKQPPDQGNPPGAARNGLSARNQLQRSNHQYGIGLCALKPLQSLIPRSSLGGCNQPIPRRNQSKPQALHLDGDPKAIIEKVRRGYQALESIH